MKHVDVWALPKRTILLMELAGIGETYAFLKQYGLGRAFVPESLDKAQLIKERYGDKIAAALVDLWPGQYIDIPKVDKITMQWRNQELYNDVRVKNMRICEASKKYLLTRQHCMKILREIDAQKADEQDDPNLAFDF